MADPAASASSEQQQSLSVESIPTEKASEPSIEDGFQFDSYNKLLAEAATPQAAKYSSREGRKATLFAFSPVDLQTAVIAEAQNAVPAPTGPISPRPAQYQAVLPVDTQRLINPQAGRQRARSKSTGAAPLARPTLQATNVGFHLPPTMSAKAEPKSPASPPPMTDNIPGATRSPPPAESIPVRAISPPPRGDAPSLVAPVPVAAAAAQVPRDPRPSHSPLARVQKQEQAGRSRRRSNAAPTISKTPKHRTIQLTWSKLEWSLISPTRENLQIIRESADNEINFWKAQATLYKKAFEDMFQKQSNRSPTAEDLSSYKPQAVPFGEWLLQIDAEKLRIVQRTIRKHNMRVKFRELSREYMKSQGTSAARTRNEIVREIMMTEKAYVGSMRTLVEEFQKPLLKAATEGRLRGKEDAASITRLLRRVFSNVEEILAFQQDILQQLVTEFNKWPGPMSVTQIFMDMAPKLRTYSTYVNNYDSAIEALATLSRTTNFREIHSEITRRPHCNLGLEMLLIMPVQRIPRYELLLKQLQKMTPPEHRDAASLPTVIKIIEDTATHINEEKRKSEAKEQLYSLQRKIRDCPDLLTDGRTLVYKGKLNITGNRLSAVFKNKRGVYLFTDMVMVTAQNLSGQICEEWSLLKDVQVVDSVEEGQFVLLFLSPTGRTRRRYQLLAETDTLKAYWLQHFNKFTTQNRRNTSEFIETMSQHAATLASASSSQQFNVASSTTSGRSESNPGKAPVIQASSSSPSLNKRSSAPRPANQNVAFKLPEAETKISSPPVSPRNAQPVAQPSAPRLNAAPGPVRSQSASDGLNKGAVQSRSNSSGPSPSAAKVNFQLPVKQVDNPPASQPKAAVAIPKLPARPQGAPQSLKSAPTSPLTSPITSPVSSPPVSPRTGSRPPPPVPQRPGASSSGERRAPPPVPPKNM